jgi:hypothetical protein
VRGYVVGILKNNRGCEAESFKNYYRGETRSNRIYLRLPVTLKYIKPLTVNINIFLLKYIFIISSQPLSVSPNV